MRNLIDTHCHLAHGRLIQQIPDLLARARAAGVERVLCAAATVAESRAAVHIARDHDGVRCLAGLHPHEAAEADDHTFVQLRQLVEKPENVAVGEIGLDYHYDFSPRDVQQRVFAEQLALAVELGKPIVIHTREAFADTLAILDESAADPTRVLLHSFTGDADEVRQGLDRGLWVSFSGIVTFKNAGDIRAAARLVPADRILVETDAPYLSPEPVRKIKTNEPAHVAHTARQLAQLRGTDAQDFADLTTANAERFFGL